MPVSSSTEPPESRATLARALFSPASVALVGAGADPSKLASRPQRVLRHHGFKGVVVPIHPVDHEVCGDRAYAAVSAVPGGVDHAFIMVPAPSVLTAVEDCCAARVKVATIFSAGFAERGAQGQRRQDLIVAAAHAGGMRLLGPNCLGIVNVPAGVALSANAVLEHEVLNPGGLSVISQSGSMLGAIITRAQERGLGFAKLISVGNECDLGVGELVDLLVDDPDTRAVLLFLEAFRDAAVLGPAARRAYAAGKPVIAFKLGRSTIGRQIATSHTGALAGADDVADAFFSAHGILRVEIFEALFETAQLVLGHRPPKGRRVGALTVSGGAAAMVVDRLGLAGIEVVPPTPRMVANLAAQRIRITDAPLIDLPMGRADRGAYRTILDELLTSDHCDVVLAVQGSAAAYTPQSIRERVLDAKRVAKPLAVFVGPRAEAALRLLQHEHTAGFRTPEACADAIRAYCDWRAPTDPEMPAAPQCSALQTSICAAGTGTLNEHASAELLGKLGIPCSPSRLMCNGRESMDLPYPVAAKILSADIPHKTEAGGVVLDITDASALSRCIDAMLARIRAELPDARIDGVLVQPMHQGLAEAIVGYRHDPEVGPVVIVGVGGVLAEVCAGRAVRLAPVSVETASEMIASVCGLASIRGYRNRPLGDLGALAQVVHRMSLLALEPRVLEAEVNPLLVRSDGVVALDALVRIADR